MENGAIETNSTVGRSAVTQFRTPKKTLGTLDADSAAKLVAASSDVALVLDAKGVIKDVAFADGDLAKDGFDEWIGKRWIDTVSLDSKQKIEDLLRDSATAQRPRLRQVNHPSMRGGPDVPVQYSAISVGGGKIVAVGRDLRSLASLQRRLVDAQQSMERDYARMRNSETRYRLLFQISSEPVLVVDGSSLLVTEANAAAGRLLSKSPKRLVGRSFPELFDAEGSKAVNVNLGAVRAAGSTEPLRVKLAETKVEVSVSASAFRQEGTVHFLVRLAGLGADVSTGSRTQIPEVVENLPDGFVVTDTDCKILSANAAFLDLIQASSEQQLIGHSLDRWLGRHATELGVVVSNLREHGSVRHFFTIVRGQFNASEDVEISAVSVSGGEQPCFGFTMRSVARRPEFLINGRRELPRSVEQLTQLVGRVALKDLVRESTDVIERLCIEAALELTGDNRASAADMLGLSRQSLYSKLRRHGLGDLDGDGGS